MDYTLLLPLETLCYVLTCAQRANPIRIDRATRRRPGQSVRTHRVIVLAWLNTTHVNSRWRSVAMHNPPLWTNIPTTLGIEWLREFVARSGNAPISINWQALRLLGSGNGSRRHRHEEAVLPAHYNRVRNLVATLTDRTESVLHSLLSYPWPMLEKIEIKLDHSGIQYLTLFDHNLPHLRRLTWQNYHQVDSGLFPWEAPSIRTLTCLRITLPTGIHNGMMDRFLDAVARMSSLEHLLLKLSRSMLGPCPACNSGKQVHFGSLKVLWLSSDFRDISHIMSHITPSANVKVRLQSMDQCTDRTFDADAMNHALSCIPIICSRLLAWYHALPSLPSFVAAALAGRMRFQFSMRLSRSPFVPKTMESGSWDEHVDEHHPDLEIVLPVNDGGAKAMMMVLEELAPHSIRALTLTNTFSSLLPSFVHPVFRHIVALHIPPSTISSCSNAKCLQFLATTSGTMFPFPLLKTLVLSHQSPYGVLSLVSNTIQTNPQNQNNLQDCISARYASGIPLRAVYLDISEIQKVLDGQTKPRTNWAPVFSNRIEIRRVINELKKIPEVVFLPGMAQLYDDALWRTIVGESS